MIVAQQKARCAFVSTGFLWVVCEMMPSGILQGFENVANALNLLSAEQTLQKTAIAEIKKTCEDAGGKALGDRITLLAADLGARLDLLESRYSELSGIVYATNVAEPFEPASAAAANPQPQPLCEAAKPKKPRSTRATKAVNLEDVQVAAPPVEEST
jgi:hypothetical protein